MASDGCARHLSGRQLRLRPARHRDLSAGAAVARGAV